MAGTTIRRTLTMCAERATPHAHAERLAPTRASHLTLRAGAGDLEQACGSESTDRVYRAAYTLTTRVIGSITRGRAEAG